MHAHTQKLTMGSTWESVTLKHFIASCVENVLELHWSGWPPYQLHASCFA